MLTTAILMAALMASGETGHRAERFGFSPAANGKDNRMALQKSLDGGGTVVVDVPGDYRISGTVLIGDNTTLRCGAGVRFVKSDEEGKFSHVILNKGALTKTWNTNIEITGLELVVNGVDHCDWQVFGLRGQVAFFYAKDVRVNRFRCADLGKAQYCLQFCTFEDVIVDDVRVFGGKDGVHFGRGRRFSVRNGVFNTGDDAIALNAHDYSSGNPELGWIEDGVVENCHDLENPAQRAGYFCRILAGAWTDWREGMSVRLSDTVVSRGRLYRVGNLPANGRTYVSKTRPVHGSGTEKLDGIPWTCVQVDVCYNCGVRNVVFRDIFLHKPRTAFSVHYDNDRFSRSYYPGSSAPQQAGILFENVNVLHDGACAFLAVGTPVDSVMFSKCVFGKSGDCVRFVSNQAMKDYGRTLLSFVGCRFRAPESQILVGGGSVPGKVVSIAAVGNLWDSDGFRAKIDLPAASVVCRAGDLPGLLEFVTGKNNHRE